MNALDVAIIGAGPYGLSLAAHLQRSGLGFACFGDPMSSWRKWMPAGMLLRSEGHASNLWDPARRYTIEAFAREHGLPYRPSGLPVPLAMFLAYADWFRAHAVPPVRETVVRRLSTAPDGFELALEDGECVTARHVVVATGHRAYRYVPDSLQGLPPSFVSHSCDHPGFARLQGRNVLVVGGGQSALETAALLHEAGVATRVVMRASRVIWNPPVPERRSLAFRARLPESGLGFGWTRLLQSNWPALFRAVPPRTRLTVGLKALGPSGAWWLRDRVVGRIPVLTGHELAGARADGNELALQLRAGERMVELRADHAIAATGFRPDVAKLSFLAPELRARMRTYGGLPILHGSESSVSGLHFMGMPTVGTFGPVMRFMFGAKHAAPILARELIEAVRLRRARPSAPRAHQPPAPRVASEHP